MAVKYFKRCGFALGFFVVGVLLGCGLLRGLCEKAAACEGTMNEH